MPPLAHHGGERRVAARVRHLVAKLTEVLGEDGRQQRARLQVEVVLGERAVGHLRRVRPRPRVARDHGGGADRGGEALHQRAEVALEVLEAQDVRARVLHVQPLRQPMAVGHRRAVDARARRAHGVRGEVGPLALEPGDGAVGGAEHRVDVRVERLGGAQPRLVVDDEGGGRGIGRQLEGELADGALRRVAHDAKGLLQRVDAAALAARAEGRERQVPRRARLPRVEAAERAVRVRLLGPLRLLLGPQVAVPGADLLHGRAARLGDVDKLQHVVQRRLHPSPSSELLAIDLSARLVLVRLVLDQAQPQLAALGRLGRPADVEVGATDRAVGAHAHEAERRHADAQPLEGAQVVAHLALGARREELARRVHHVELAQERSHHGVARAVGEAVVDALPVLEVGHAQPEAALRGAPQQRRGKAGVCSGHDHVGVPETKLLLALDNQAGHAAHAEAGAHDVEADLGVRDGGQPDARHLGRAVAVHGGLGDLEETVGAVRVVLVVRVRDARADQFEVLRAQLHPLLALDAGDGVQVAHNHRVHEDIHCPIGRLEQRREQVLLNARKGERGAALRAVEGDGDARLLVCPRDATPGRPLRRHGAAIDLGGDDGRIGRGPKDGLQAGAQLRQGDVVDALLECPPDAVVIHLAVPSRHGPLAGLAARALGGAAARLLCLPVLLRLVGVVGNVREV
eukprot:scaffold14556_cov67-Phaeocystis_antarctica.AAC.3